MNPFDMMKNLQKMQESMQTMQEKLKTVVVVGLAGGDLVKATVNGQMEVIKIELAPECVDPRDIPMLQDLIKLAVNDGFAKVREKMKEELGALAPGLDLAGKVPGFPL